MKAKKGDKVKIVKKMNDWSSDYQEGDVFTVESTWYGGINVTSSTGIPLSIDEIEYEIIGKEPASQPKGKVIFHAEDIQGSGKSRKVRPRALPAKCCMPDRNISSKSGNKRTFIL